jgi:hypothetical protein
MWEIASGGPPPSNDTLVLPAVTRSYMQELCKAGSAVQWYPVDGEQP